MAQGIVFSSWGGPTILGSNLTYSVAGSSAISVLTELANIQIPANTIRRGITGEFNFGLIGSDLFDNGSISIFLGVSGNESLQYTKPLFTLDQAISAATGKSSIPNINLNVYSDQLNTTVNNAVVIKGRTNKVTTQINHVYSYVFGF